MRLSPHPLAAASSSHGLLVGNGGLEKVIDHFVMLREHCPAVSSAFLIVFETGHPTLPLLFRSSAREA